MQLTKKRGSCVEVFKGTDHIIVAATGIHPGSFFFIVNPVILSLLVYQGCFIERVLLFSGKLMGTFRITLQVG